MPTTKDKSTELGALESYKTIPGGSQGSVRQGQDVKVELVDVLEYTGLDGSQGARVHFKVSAASDSALWEYFEVRKSRLEEELRRAVAEAGGGRMVVERIEYRHGSLSIILVLLQVAIQVAGQYPNLKQGFREIASDIGPLIRWVQEEVAPRVQRRIENFFEEYKDAPPIRMLKSLFRGLFG